MSSSNAIDSDGSDGDDDDVMMMGKWSVAFMTYNFC